MDLVSEAQTVQQLTAAGLPKKIAFEQLSFVDNVDYIMDEIEAEKDDIPSLMQQLPEDDEKANNEKDIEKEEDEEAEGNM